MVFETIRRVHPVIHAITNAVTVNDVVNMILASGGSAICADEEKEAAEITALCQGLLLNTGMPNDNKLKAMLASGKRANERGIPVVLDPVGAGASQYRREFIRTLLSEVHFSAIRCNMSEAAALSGIAFSSKGVEDAGVILSKERLQDLAGAYDTVLAVTGERDFAVTGDRILESCTGTPLLKRITGAGCMLSGLVAALLAAADAEDGDSQTGKKDLCGGHLELVYQLLSEYGSASEEAERKMQASEHVGTASFRMYLIDEISCR